MTVPEVDLDDRRFQDLVDEARERIRARCPEWTDHNVSDPGITLVESFAWMTEQLIFKLNRVPEKLHVELLALLGIELDPATASRVDLRFRLIENAELPVRIPAHITEVTAEPAEAVFRVKHDFLISDLRPVAFVQAKFDVERPGAGKPAPERRFSSVPVEDGYARPAGPETLAFSETPRVDDAIHLGFAEPLSLIVLRVEVEMLRASGVGIDPDDPPLEWSVSGRDGVWEPVEPVDILEDTTGGFNRESGHVDLQMPLATGELSLGGLRLYWVRCRVTDKTRSGKPAARFSTTPRLSSITARPVGALVPAVNAARQPEELLGVSDGTPGQRFTLRQESVLPLESPDGLEVRSDPAEGWIPWVLTPDFKESGPHHLHYTFDPASRVVKLGPAIRDDKRWVQRGSIPPRDAEIRMSGYWHGGGSRGDARAHTLTVLRSGLPGVAAVTNPLPARGGSDAETLEAGRERAGDELVGGRRAVTVDDIRFLAVEVGDVARAFCSDPPPGQKIEVGVLAMVAPSRRRPTRRELEPSTALLERIGKHLDERRMAGSQIVVKPVPLVGVTVVADVVASRYASLDAVHLGVIAELEMFINPLGDGGSATDGSRAGWQFGRAVTQGEVLALVERVQDVERVVSLRLFRTELSSDGQSDRPHPKDVGARMELAPSELPASSEHFVRVTHGTAR